MWQVKRKLFETRFASYRVLLIHSEFLGIEGLSEVDQTFIIEEFNQLVTTESLLLLTGDQPRAR